MSTPLATVKNRFESKAQLTEAVQELMTDELWLPRLSSDRGGSRQLKNVSNAKLLRLHSILTEVKEKFGSRDELINAILTLENRSKDEGYRKRLGKYPVPRLYDSYKVAKKKSA